MALEKMKICGFRGFSSEQTISFAMPNGKEGSGLTIITGSNNSGKSSIIECLRAISGNRPPSFSVGMRNSKIDKVEITCTTSNGKKIQLKSIEKGSSETTIINNDIEKLYFLPSRRAFTTYFNKMTHQVNRHMYTKGEILQPQRNHSLNNFHQRLFDAQKNKDNFNKILFKILYYNPEWTIDQSDQGMYFLKFYNGKQSHSSDGVGEGIISVFSIVDALYDSTSDDVIVIDEPELSLHPSLQKRTFKVLKEYAKDRQIIISTHSAYFVDTDAIINGANVVRVCNAGEGAEIFQLSNKSVESISKLAKNDNNPHIFGLESREIFFLEDNVIILEGQEDVVLFPNILNELEIEMPVSFFWMGRWRSGKYRAYLQYPA